LLDLVIVLWRNNFKSIPSIKEYQHSHSCCSCTIADTEQSSRDSGCTIVLLSFFQRSSKNKHPMPSNSSEIVVAPGFYSFFNDRHDHNNSWQTLKLPSLSASDDPQLRIIFSFWWRQLLVVFSFWECFWWRQLLMIFRTSCLQNLFSSDASLQLKDPFCRFIFSHLFFRTYALFKDTQIFVYGPAHLNKYHQKSKGNVKYFLFQQHIPAWI